MTRQVRPRLVCVGSVVVDIVMQVPGLPDPGGDVVARASMLAVGGAFNVMSAARSQGLPVIYAGAHGTGPFGEMVRSSLARIGAEIAAPAASAPDTGFSVTFVASDGERTFATAPGAEALSSHDRLDAIPIHSRDLVYVSGYRLVSAASGAILARWLSRLDASVTVVVDPGSLVNEIHAELLGAVYKRSDWWTCNEREADLVTGIANPYDAIRGLAKLTGRKGILVRLGSEGCLLLRAGRDVQHIPALAVDAVDTTGAGDAHSGIFLAALAQAIEPSEAVYRANVGASISVSRWGPAAAPTSEELTDALAGRRPRVTPAEGHGLVPKGLTSCASS